MASSVVKRTLASLLLVTGAMAGVYAAERRILPEEGKIASGIRIGDMLAPSEAPSLVAEAMSKALLERPIKLMLGKTEILSVTLAELSAEVDTVRLEARLFAVGREGDWFDRTVDALAARRGQVRIPLFVSVPIEPLAERLGRVKEEQDTEPRGARFDFAKGNATPHEPGRFLDLYAAASLIEKAALRGESSVELPIIEIAPRASQEVVASLDTSKTIASYSTRYGYLGGQANRAQNVGRAAALMDGVVILPGEIASFNAEVGPRSKENGFTTAPEIYKGELREGIGGGTCQMASTLHAAAYLGGFEIQERINHSRPSGYIPMGLDATVVYPHVDLKLKNPYAFPIVVHTIADKGTLTVELRGSGSADAVEWSTATVGTAAYKRKVEESAFLTEGHFVLKQKGIRGYSVRKTRIIHAPDGQTRVEEKTDVYPPTFEILVVPQGFDLTTLPPLPTDEPQKSG